MTSGTTPPVLIIIFNRPDKVRMLMGALSISKPSRLYIAADGARQGVRGEAELCEATRALARVVPWPCTVETLFSERNLGVDPAVERAITWFFEHEDEGVILEDDCIPHPDFFSFAHEILERYRGDEHVMMISGNNFQQGTVRGNGSYYFSRYPTTWGWATWKRAWNAYDSSLSLLPTFVQDGTIQDIRPYADEQHYWLKYFRKLRVGIYTAWDAKWLFAIWYAGGICITPNQNLVRNVGFDHQGTHTRDHTANLAATSHALPPPYAAPTDLTPDAAADRFLFDTLYRTTVLQRVQYRLNRILR